MTWQGLFEKIRHPQSLRMRLTMLVMAVAVAVLVTTSAIINDRAIDIIEQNPRQQLIAANETLSTTVTVWLESHVSALRNLVSLPDVTSMSAERQRPLLQKIAVAYPHMYLISTTDLRGVNVARNDQEKPKDYRDRYWYLRARDGASLVFESVIGRTMGRPALIVSMPIIGSGGRIVGVGMFGVDLSQLARQVHAAKVGQTGFAYLVDQQNRVLAHPDPAYANELRDMTAYPPVAALRNGVTGEVRYQDDQGRPWRAYVSTLKNGWGVVVQQQEDEWLLARRLFQKLAVGTIAVAVLLLMVVTWWGVRRSLAPMETLSKTISGIAGTGDINQTDLDSLRRVLRSMRQGDEVGILTASFDRMAERLQETLANLSQELAERRQTEASLRDSEEKYRTLVDHLPVGVYRNTGGPHGRFIQANPAMVKMFGYDSLDDFLRISVSDLYQNAEDRLALVQEMMQHGSVHDRDLALRRKDGSPLWARVNAAALCGAEGNIQWMDGVIEDITEQKLAQKALIESEEKFHSLVDNVNVGIIRATMEPRGKIISVNRAILKIFGYEDTADVSTLVVSDHYADADQRNRLLMELTSGGSVKNWEVAMRRKDGTPLWISLSSTLQRDSQGQPQWVDSVVEDITERKKLEEQLVQSQKMEAIGTLAGGVAHDFNNILTAIIGYGNLLKLRLEADGPLKVYVNDILMAADRAAHLTHSLLAFSRKQIMSPKPVDLNEIVQRIDKLLMRVIGEDVEFKTILTDELLTVMADSGQIEQVLLNLATNARDAMPDGGTLILRVEKAIVPRSHPCLKPGNYGVLSVSDTGKGMDDATKRRIFEPFFTTKEKDKGTGLGLSIVYGIVKQHSGETNVYSEPGKGTTFKIYLPLVEPKAPDTEEERERAPQRGTETILVAEDDPNVRELMRSILEQFGYTVIEAVDGEDAVVQYNAHREAIQMMLLDVVMPRKNGREAYDIIAKDNPGIRVLFSSGYTADIIHKKGILDEGLNFISKPVAPSQLLLKIREILDRS